MEARNPRTQINKLERPSDFNNLNNNFFDLYRYIEGYFVDKNTSQTISGTKTFSNGIKTGGKHWELIGSTSTNSTVGSLTVSGLNGDVDIRYMICFRWICGDGGGYLGMRINGDTGNNYGYTIPASPNSPETTQTNVSYISIDYSNNTNFVGSGVYYLEAKKNYYRTMIGNAAGGGGNGGAGLTYCYTESCIWSNTTDNITSITFFASNNIIAGSQFDIFALR